MQDLIIECIDRTEILNYIDSESLILFIDENEIRSMETYLTITLGKEYVKRAELSTYMAFLNNRGVYGREQFSIYLNDLSQKGINIVGLVFKDGDYFEKLNHNICLKFSENEDELKTFLSPNMYRDFFCDLYEEKYVEEILHIPYKLENVSGCIQLKDYQSRYCNIKNGERYTCDQPIIHTKTIYFFGPCYIYGHYVEDQYTIESYLQKQLNIKGYSIKVVNYGSLGGSVLHRIAVTPLKKGDIIIIDRPPSDIEGVKYLNLADVLECKNVGAEWFVDMHFHCNHKVNALYADAIYTVLEPVLDKEVYGCNQLIEKNRNYIKILYLDQYFSEYVSSRYSKIGAVVVNCNPFTYGHRYLIEQALRVVDYLIIFVVEENKSIFSFAERFNMVRQGVADLSNILVAPSGPFILSQMTFPEYFIKETSEDIIEHTEQDIVTFAEAIAPQLGIQYRFVGEEITDEVTNQYNLSMKKILPMYGIKLIEISRKKENGQDISASLVRKYLVNNNRQELVKLLPGTTRMLLGI